MSVAVADSLHHHGVATLLVERISHLDAPHVLAIEATVAESPGQGASCTIELARPTTP
jgi:hypothetical protein